MSATMDVLRARVPFEEFDYQVLLGALRDYASPRDRITRLLASGAIVRVKKGLYVFGPTYRRHQLSLELLANLVSGPSYVSFEYALASYGLVPESVKTVTSASFGKARTFDTPVARFSYRPVPRHVFPVGMTLIGSRPDRTYLMASREKALCDTIVSSRRLAVRSVRALETTLADDLRINMDLLRTLDASEVRSLAAQWPSRRLALLAKVIAHE